MQQGAVGNPSKVTRRGLLKTLVTVGAGGALGGPLLTGRAAASAEPAKTGHQWAFVIDLRRCDGCQQCTKACQKAHYLGSVQTWIKVYTMENRAGLTHYMPRLCMLCENPPCVKVCPVGATFRNPEGVVLVDQNICIGCRTCMAACPYEARYFNWTQPPPAPGLLQQPMPEFPVPQKKGTVGKCILCAHNTNVGKLPVCVEACTMEALYIGDITADAVTNGRETLTLSKFLQDNDATLFREELGTRPRVWYILGHGQDLDF